MAKSVPTFPYRYKQINFGKIFNPLALIPVKASWGWQRLWFLIDSGADVTMIPVSLANELGIKYNPNAKDKLYGIGQQALPASPGKLKLMIGNREIEIRSYFVHSQDSILLLGRLDIFEQFSVNFDRSSQSVIFSN